MKLIALALLLGLTACAPDGASNAASQDPSDAQAPRTSEPKGSDPGAPVEPSVAVPGQSVDPSGTVHGEPVEPQPELPNDNSTTALPGPELARPVPEDLLTQDEVQYACNTPTDCEVKNVGNCCGYYPACVNKDSPTFPEKVKAACAAEGMNSICGFPEISSCDCIEGRCAPISGPGGGGDVR